MGVGDAWGTREEMLHPRDSHGRFRSSWKMAQGVVDKIIGILSKFNPKMFTSQEEANGYVKGLATRNRQTFKPSIEKFLKGYSQVNADLRAGKPNKDADEMRRLMQPLPDDLIITRTGPPSIVGLDPASAGNAEELTGKLVRDKGFWAANIGGPLPHQDGNITFTMAVPKGTKALAPSTSKPNGELIFEPEQPFRITEVNPDGRGGFFVYAVAAGDSEAPEAVDIGKAVPEAGVPETPAAAPQAAAPAPATSGGQAPNTGDLGAPLTRKPGRPAGPAPAARNEGHVADNVGGGQAPGPSSAPSTNEPAPSAPELPPAPEAGTDARNTFRDAFDKADLKVPTVGTRRKQFMDAYSGVASGKKTPQEAVNDLDNAISANKKIIASDKADGTDSGPLPEDVKRQEALRDLIAEHFNFTGRKKFKESGGEAPSTPAKKATPAPVAKATEAPTKAAPPVSDDTIARMERERKAKIRREMRAEREARGDKPAEPSAEQRLASETARAAGEKRAAQKEASNAEIDAKAAGIANGWLADAGVQESDLTDFQKTGLKVISGQVATGRITRLEAARRLRSSDNPTMTKIADAVKTKKQVAGENAMKEVRRIREQAAEVAKRTGAKAPTTDQEAAKLVVADKAPKPVPAPARPQIPAKELSDKGLLSRFEAEIKKDNPDEARLKELGDELDRRDLETKNRVQGLSDSDLEKKFQTEIRKDNPDEEEMRRLGDELDRRDKERADKERKIEQLVAKGRDYRDAWAEVNGKNPEDLDLEERKALLDQSRRAGESRETTLRRLYQEHVHRQYLDAERETRGHLLTPESRAKGIDPKSLFQGSNVNANRYASDELKEYWETHPRKTFLQYKADTLGRKEDIAAAKKTEGVARNLELGEKLTRKSPTKKVSPFERLMGGPIREGELGPEVPKPVKTAPKAAPKPPRIEDTPEGNKILNAYQEMKKGSQGWADAVELRERSGLSKEDFEKEIGKLIGGGGDSRVRGIPVADRKSLSDKQRSEEMRFGDEPVNAIKIDVSEADTGPKNIKEMLESPAVSAETRKILQDALADTEIPAGRPDIGSLDEARAKLNKSTIANLRKAAEGQGIDVPKSARLKKDVVEAIIRGMAQKELDKRRGGAPTVNAPEVPEAPKVQSKPEWGTLKTHGFKSGDTVIWYGQDRKVPKSEGLRGRIQFYPSGWALKDLETDKTIHAGGFAHRSWFGPDTEVPKTEASPAAPAPGVPGDIDRMTIPQLRDEAKRQNRRIPSNVTRKADIVEFLKGDDNKVQSKAIRESAAKPSGAEIKARFDRMTSSEDGENLLDSYNFTRPELVQIAKDMNIVHAGRATKQEIKDQILHWGLRRRLQSEAVATPGPTGGSRVLKNAMERKGPKRSTKPKIENNWGVPGGEVNFHEDGNIGGTIHDLGRTGDADLEVNGDRLDNTLGKAATQLVQGDITQQDLIDKLRSMSVQLDGNGSPEAARLLRRAADRMDSPHVKRPELPEGTPDPIGLLMEQLLATPLARSSGPGGRDSEIQALAKLMDDWRDEKITPTRLPMAVREATFNRRHESNEGKFQIDRVVNEAVQSIEEMGRKDRDSLRPPSLRKAHVEQPLPQRVPREALKNDLDDASMPELRAVAQSEGVTVPGTLRSKKEVAGYLNEVRAEKSKLNTVPELKGQSETLDRIRVLKEAMRDEPDSRVAPSWSDAPSMIILNAVEGLQDGSLDNPMVSRMLADIDGFVPKDSPLRKLIKDARSDLDDIYINAQGGGGNIGPEKYHVGSTQGVEDLIRDVTPEVLADPKTKRERISTGQVGANAKVTLPNGKTVFEKTSKRVGLRAGETSSDSEQLLSAMGTSLGAPTLPTMRMSPDTIYTDWVGDMTLGEQIIGDLSQTPVPKMQKLWDSVKDSRESKILGLLDLITFNGDRHPGNWGVRDGKLVAIDNGMGWGFTDIGRLGGIDPAKVDLERNVFVNLRSRFMVEHMFERYESKLKDNDFTLADIEKIRKRLEALRDQFRHLGREEWLDLSLKALDIVKPHAKGTKDLIT